MNKGIYIALSGALLKQRDMDVYAQNMANATTTGYKKERISFKDYIMPSDNKQNNEKDSRTMSEISEVITDFSSGTLMKTDNPLDVAISGKGLFALENNRYTRDGSFKINSEGNLVTKDNIKVLGTGGPISIQGNRIDINDSGEIFVDSVSVGALKVVDFANKSVLVKVEGGNFVTNEQGEAVDSQVNQGFLEGSNVQVVREMVKMLTALREFESYSKMIQSFDDAESQTIDKLGS